MDVIKNPNYFDDSFIPSEIFGRESEILELKTVLNSLVARGVITNTLVFGQSGVGKTLVTKYVVSKLKENYNIKDIYVNGFEFRTRSSILSFIANALGKAAPRRGIGIDELFHYVISGLDSTGEKVIIIVDEADKLNSFDIFYDLSRLNAFVDNVPLIITITNNLEPFLLMDERIKTKILSHMIEFKRYTVPVLKEILSYRAEHGFFKNSYEQEAISLAAAYAYKAEGHVRTGISLLYKAALLAEASDSVLTSDFVKKAFGSMFPNFKPSALQGLTDQELFLLKALKEKPLLSGELFSRLSSVYNVSERQFRNYISNLLKRNLIIAEDVQLKPKGKSRRFSLNIPTEYLD